MLPRWLKQGLLRIQWLWRPRQLDRDLDEEFAFHMAMWEERKRMVGTAIATALLPTRRGTRVDPMGGAPPRKHRYPLELPTEARLQSKSRGCREGTCTRGRLAAPPRQV